MVPKFLKIEKYKLLKGTSVGFHYGTLSGAPLRGWQSFEVYSLRGSHAARDLPLAVQVDGDVGFLGWITTRTSGCVTTPTPSFLVPHLTIVLVVHVLVQPHRGARCSDGACNVRCNS